MLPNISYMTLFRQLMIAFEVARNGLPSMIGIQLVLLAIGSVSRTINPLGSRTCQLELGHLQSYLLEFSQIYLLEIE